jgi:two-component system alkaline phosphatase synthesis response regulator PhoP
MTKEHILVVEDDEDVLELLRYNLTKEGFRVTGVTSGEEALLSTKAQTFDLVLLDLILPGIDGLEICRHLKRDSITQHIPVVMVTAKGEEADIVTGLELGADDYIVKPFSIKVLLAQINSVLRRRSQMVPGDDDPISIHGILIHPNRYKVMVEGKVVDLTATEFRLLHLLARRPGWIFTRTQIVRGMHGNVHPISNRSVDVKVVGLRKKLGPAGQLIETVHGVGYRFKG